MPLLADETGYTMNPRFLLAAALLLNAPLRAQEPEAASAPDRATLASAPEGYLDAPKREPGSGYSQINVEGPYIAITFDDGPHATFTPRLLDILKARDVKATFFIVGRNAEMYPSIMQRIVDEGHEIANHSWSHPNLAKMSDSAVRKQVADTQSIIRQTTGIQAISFRPPYGSITARQRVWIEKEFGVKTIMWAVDPLDWKNRNANTVETRIVEKTRPGSIILAHDIHKSTVDAMPGTLDRLLARGYRFLTVKDLLAREVAAPKAAPAPVEQAPPPELRTVRAEPVNAPSVPVPSSP